MTERILIVDDHPLTRDALAALLKQNGFDVVGQAGGGEEAIGLARELMPDLVLLDLSMPDMDGLTALPKLREAAPSTEVVVLTASEDEDNLLGAIRSGAAGYLLKSEPPERIVAFLRGVAQGEAALSAAVAGARRCARGPRRAPAARPGARGRRSHRCAGVGRSGVVRAGARGAAAA